MKEISWTDLKKEKLEDIKKGQCLKVTGDGQMVFYVIVYPEGIMRNRIETYCNMIDTGRGL